MARWMLGWRRHGHKKVKQEVRETTFFLQQKGLVAGRLEREDNVLTMAKTFQVNVGEEKHLAVASADQEAVCVCFRGQRRDGDSDGWIGSTEGHAARHPPPYLHQLAVRS